LRSPHPYARIVSIDLAAAWKIDGVDAIITAADVPGTPTYGLISQDQPVFAADVVRYVGEPVAASISPTARPDNSAPRPPARRRSRSETIEPKPCRDFRLRPGLQRLTSRQMKTVSVLVGLVLSLAFVAVAADKPP
jgi:hypothetical protein